jgi:phosphotransferase system HPr (HPr) family protein
MPLEFTFTCPLPNSIHARPANALEEVAAQFESAIIMKNDRNKNEADVKSILSLVSADIQHGDPCRIIIAGKDEENAFTTLKSFIENEFANCDEPLPEIEVTEGKTVLPRMLRNEKVSCLPGIPVSRGLGRGKAVIADGLALSSELLKAPIQNPEKEWKSVDNALVTLRSSLAGVL